MNTLTDAAYNFDFVLAAGHELAEVQTTLEKHRANCQVDDADWQDILRGYYAVPVDNGRYDENFRVLAYYLYERTTPRTYKNGRTVGRKHSAVSRAD